MGKLREHVWALCASPCPAGSQAGGLLPPRAAFSQESSILQHPGADPTAPTHPRTTTLLLWAPQKDRQPSPIPCPTQGGHRAGIKGQESSSKVPEVAAGHQECHPSRDPCRCCWSQWSVLQSIHVIPAAREKLLPHLLPALIYLLRFPLKPGRKTKREI